MTFNELLAQILQILHREGRVSYRALKRRFDLDDDYLEDLKEEIITAKGLAADENGRVLVWLGAVDTSHGNVAHTEPPGVQVSKAERRQLTVMFCDLVDSTALSGLLDLEDFHEVIRAYQEMCAEVIRRFDGHVAQYLGDGILVYFGYPYAHEEDAQRAVHAGLGIIEAIGPLKARLAQTQDIHLAVRIGIHTGLVVVGDIGSGARQEQLALGETPNIASRIQALAEPDTVIISSSTLHLVQGFFLCYPFGEHPLRGVTQPIALYRVSDVSEAQSRFEVAVTTGLMPLVGREAEMIQLSHLWEQVQRGEGGTVLLHGESGIGKSRLVQELREYAGRGVCTRIQFRCSPYHQQSVLYPLINHLQWLFRLHQDDSPEEKLDKLEKGLKAYRFASQDVLALFAMLLSLPTDRYAPLHLSPQRQKQKLLEAWLDWIVEEAERHPVLVVWEDLHWADPSSLEALSLYIGRAPIPRVLSVMTFRPTFQSPWTSDSPLIQLTLSRLDRTHVVAMLEHLTDAKGLPTEVVQQLVAKTDGVPLFVEELTKMVLESGLLRETQGSYELSEPLPDLAIPSSLHDSLMSRLDRLTIGKEVAQLAATLGREFSYELIQAVWPGNTATLQRGLDQLVATGLIYLSKWSTQTLYMFKHALIQDTAYQSLLRRTRRHYHQQIAHTLEEQFSDVAELHPELLAHHYTEAGLRSQAIGFWHSAGQHAIQRSAYTEAIDHLTKGLEVLQEMPDTLERNQHELALHVTLGAPLLATKGYAAPEVGQVFTRALELCQHAGETPHLFQVLQGLWAFYLVRADLQMARELGERLLSLARGLQDPDLILEAALRLGITLSTLGELVSAREYLEQELALYDPVQHRAHAFVYGQDPQVSCLCHLSLVLWLMGYPTQALQRSYEAVRLAQELSHSFSLAWALLYTAMTHTLCRDWRATREQAEALIRLSSEQGFSYRLAQGRILQGWALVQQGQGEEEAAIDQMQQSLAAVRATGAEVYRPFFLTLLAEVYGRVGRVEAGLTVMDEGLTSINKSNERFYEAELLRLKGTLLLALSTENVTTAETCFQHALNMARRQQAKALELRAAVSLGQLWLRRGKRQETRQLLTEIVGWFTEGADTMDLQEANALLAQLA